VKKWRELTMSVVAFAIVVNVMRRRWPHAHRYIARRYRVVLVRQCRLRLPVVTVRAHYVAYAPAFDAAAEGATSAVKACAVHGDERRRVSSVAFYEQPGCRRLAEYNVACSRRA